MPLKLVATVGTRAITLPPGLPLVVGRAIDCELSVQDPTLSRRHALLAVEGGGRMRVRDLGSTNGTFVNDVRVSEALAHPGDELAFGHVRFVLREEHEPAPLPRRDPESPLDATILRLLPVRGAADIASRVSAPETGSHLRIGGASLEERQGKRLALVIDIAKELAGQPDVDRLLVKVVDLSFQVMDVDRVAVLLLDERGELATRAARSRGAGAGASGWQVPRAIAQRVLDQRVALLIEDAPVDDRFASRPGSSLPPGPLGSTERVQSALCAPLLGNDEAAFGLIYLDNLTATHSFSDEDLEFITAFAGMAAVALENSRLVIRARREAVARSNFQRYFAPELAEQIAAEEGEVSLGGVRRQVVILFSDIRGFTALAEKLSPDEIVLLLNEYFTEMVEIVFEHGGALDKFIGDALMAIWGAPLARPDDAARATRAAIAMQRELARLNRRWAPQGRRPVEVGIGLNAGEVFAGNIGSDRRLEYTVIGDAVNTAALLCSRAGPGEILLGEPLYRALPEPPPVLPLAPLALKGRAQPVPVYRVEWSVREEETPADDSQRARA